jgi:hypothetical protein
MPGEVFIDDDGYRWFVEADSTLTLYMHEEMPCYSHQPRTAVERDYGKLRLIETMQNNAII